MRLARYQCLCAATEQLAPGTSLERPDSGPLNVILRRYTRGQALGFHRDAIGLFDETVRHG